MESQCVFEIKMFGGNPRVSSPFSQFVVLDGSSMKDFSSLIEELRKSIPVDSFSIQYIDDEDDIISIDSQEEFQEFAKLVEQRTSRGLLVKLHMEVVPRAETKIDEKEKNVQDNRGEKEKKRIRASLKNERKAEEKRSSRNDSSRHTDSQGHSCCHFTEEIKSKMMADLKKEILSDMREDLGAVGYTKEGDAKKEVEFKEDYDGKKQSKRKTHKERVEKVSEYMFQHSKINKLLQRMEQKKKKLSDKTYYPLTLYPEMLPGSGWPSIMSGIEDKNSLDQYLKVTAGKPFVKMWIVFNDGTLPWKNVELRPTWSMPGLEPSAPKAKCPSLRPGQRNQVVMTFTAPSTPGPFMAYWNFFYEVDSRWLKFGHYVTVKGCTLSSKLKAPVTAKKPTEDIMTTKDANRRINSSAMEKGETNTLDVKAVNKQEPKKYSEANLASAEIAADMAREAAYAAFRRRIPIKGSSPFPAQNAIEDILKDVWKLNLMDSESESDFNNEDEETDPEFVFVEKPASFNDKPEQIDLELTVGQESEEKAVDEKVREENNSSVAGNNISSEALAKNLPVAETSGEKAQDSLNYPEKKQRNEFIEPNVPLSLAVDRIFGDANNPMKKTIEKELLAPRPLTSSFGFVDISNPVNNAGVRQPIAPQPLTTPLADANNPLKNAEGHLQQFGDKHLNLNSFSRVDPRVNYPVFPPSLGLRSTYPDVTGPNAPKNLSPPYLYQNLVPQTSYPQIMPQVLQFPTQKMSTPSYYPQMPTYSSSHPSIWQPTEVNPNNMALNQTYLASYMQPNSTSTVLQHFPGTTGNTGHKEVIYPKFSTQTKASTTPQVYKNQEPFGTPNASNAPTTNSSGYAAAGSNRTGNKVYIETSGSNRTGNKVYIGTDKHPVDGNVQSGMKLEAADSNKKSESVVQILPQALVDGAINIASTAYSTAWNALNNLRTTEGREGLTAFDPVFENNMALLVEMGFNNLERNARLLKRFNNDISQVITVICSTGGGHNLEID